jgi:hypothetical protein
MSDELPFYVLFEAVAAQAAAFELRVRLTADLSQNVRSIAVDGTMDRILRGLEEHHAEGLSADEWEFLKVSRNLRNKLFHGELHEACRIVNAPSGGVIRGVLTGDSADEILSEIRRLAEMGGPPVHGTDTRDSGVFGWLLEAYSSGAFQVMLHRFIISKKLMSKIAIAINK